MQLLFCALYKDFGNASCETVRDDNDWILLNEEEVYLCVRDHKSFVVCIPLLTSQKFSGGATLGQLNF